jgi:hypothetical protein
MSDKPYDRMTHDEILREHGTRYAKMSPQEKTRQSEERSKAERDKLAAEARRLNQPFVGVDLARPDRSD